MTPNDNERFAQSSKTVTVKVSPASAPKKAVVPNVSPIQLTYYRLEGGREPGDVIKVSYVLKNISGHVFRLGGNFSYHIGPTMSDPDKEAKAEDYFWEQMEADYKTRVFFDVRDQFMGLESISSKPLKEDESRRLKDGTYTMFFLSSYIDPKSGKPIAGFCGIVSTEQAMRICYHHNFP